MSESMVDRVALGICQAAMKGGGVTPVKALAEADEPDYWRWQARIAIASMRQPTEAMIVAGVHHDNMGDMAGRWRAMIDAALKE